MHHTLELSRHLPGHQQRLARGSTTTQPMAMHKHARQQLPTSPATHAVSTHHEHIAHARIQRMHHASKFLQPFRRASGQPDTTELLAHYWNRIFPADDQLRSLSSCTSSLLIVPDNLPLSKGKIQRVQRSKAAHAGECKGSALLRDAFCLGAHAHAHGAVPVYLSCRGSAPIIANVHARDKEHNEKQRDALQHFCGATILTLNPCSLVNAPHKREGALS